MTANQDIGAIGSAATLRGGLLQMDVADMLRQTPEIAEAADAAGKLRASYQAIGIAAAEADIAEGIAAFRDKRFDYAPPTKGIGVWLAKMYVIRNRWRSAVAAALLTLTLGFGGYYFVYKPYRISQVEQAKADLATRMPAQMDALYQTIFEETKVQQATVEAAEWRDRGKEAARKGDRDGAQAAVDALMGLRDTLQLDYAIRIVDQPGGKWGFWTFPRDNGDATNYYIVVQALDLNGQALNLKIPDEQTGRTEMVSKWGLRVPAEVYRAVEADKADDGVIQHQLVGAKAFGFLAPEYAVDVLGGTVTRW